MRKFISKAVLVASAFLCAQAAAKGPVANDLNIHRFSATATPEGLRFPAVGAFLSETGALYFSSYSTRTKTTTLWDSTTGLVTSKKIKASPARPLRARASVLPATVTVGNFEYTILELTQGAVGSCPVGPYNFSITKKNLAANRIEKEVVILRKYRAPVLIAKDDGNEGCPAGVTPLSVPDRGLYRVVTDVQPDIVVASQRAEHLFIVFDDLVMRTSLDLEPISPQKDIKVLEKSEVVRLVESKGVSLQSKF